jgi:Ca2+-binding EF-hand superfamily protein
MKPSLLASACVCALLSAPSFAQQAPAPRPLVGGHGNNIAAFIAQHDANADGRLTWQEFDAFRRARFDATDANGDGTVDVEEYVQEFEDRMREEMERGRGEQVEQTQRRFTALDTDEDGHVSRTEFNASGERVWTEGQKALAGSKDAKDGDAKTEAAAERFDRRPNRLALPSSHTAEGFLALYDGNGDGKVERGEFDQARATQFARTDTNGDVRLGQDEYLAEYEDRLDRHIATRTGGSDKQTRVRFGALDTDKDGKMTFAEYQVSGKRTFDAADRSHDGVVDAADAKLPAPARAGRPVSATPAGN